MTKSTFGAMLLDVKLAKSEKQAWAALKGEGHYAQAQRKREQ